MVFPETEGAAAATPVYHRILVPLDHTALDLLAISHAAAMAKLYGAKLYLLHVEEGVTSQIYGGESSTAEVEAGQAYLDRIARSLQGQGIAVETAGSSPTDNFAEQVRMVRSALAEAGRPAGDFAIAKRVYIAIDEDAGRARTRMNAALEGIYGYRVPAIEAAAITGTAADCVREVNQVAAAGAELILFTALFDQREQMEQLAAAVLPKLG